MNVGTDSHKNQAVQNAARIPIRNRSRTKHYLNPLLIEALKAFITRALEGSAAVSDR